LSKAALLIPGFPTKVTPNLRHINHVGVVLCFEVALPRLLDLEMARPRFTPPLLNFRLVLAAGRPGDPCLPSCCLADRLVGSTIACFFPQQAAKKRAAFHLPPPHTVSTRFSPSPLLSVSSGAPCRDPLFYTSSSCGYLEEGHTFLPPVNRKRKRPSFLSSPSRTRLPVVGAQTTAQPPVHAPPSLAPIYCSDPSSLST